MDSEVSLRIAIVGAGIVGITFAHALLERSISVQVYEQSNDIRTTGGGINATKAGVKALKRCGKQCYDAFTEVGTRHHRDRPELFWNITQSGKVAEIISDNEYGSMPRVKFIQALGKKLPAGVVKFGKKFKTLDIDPSGLLLLKFEDGSAEAADVVVGCDGVNSTIRNYVVGEGYNASFSHSVMCRGLLSATDIGEIVGENLSRGAHIGIGNGDGYVFYPINKDTVNLGYFYNHEKSWPYFPSVTHKWSKQELLEEMDTIGACSKHKAIVGLFPNEVDIWAILHTEPPLSTYAKGRIAVMGDAAHASTPFLSSGAAQGYEDAAIFAELLLAVCKRHLHHDSLHPVLEKALQIYSDVRMERSQHVVRSSREAGKLIMGSLPFDEAAEEYARRNHEVWNGDIDVMISSALQNLSRTGSE